ncbi:MAG TPA: hypothetical protein VIM45_03060 [Dehalococcoidia bacterium]|jgi:hypothetical protein
MTEQEERIDRIVREFDDQGWHRTGTEVDRRSAAWLAERVRKCGAVAELEPFSLSRVVPRSAYVEVEGRRIEGLPLFDGGFTPPEGVSGSFGPLGSSTEIGLTEGPPNAAAAGPLGDARRSAQHQAIVSITRGRSPGLAPSNARTFTEPFGPPVLQVSSEEGGWLTERAAIGTPARVVAHAEREAAEAFNVVACVAGGQPDIAPLVVMTPRSGWWQCASERGGGMACWLESMRSVAAAPVERDVFFVASSGHELGHLGLESYINHRSTLAAGALAWFHFGANIGASYGPGGRLATSDDELERLALRELSEREAGSVTTAPRGWVPNGEAHNIHIRGGRYVSIVGGNALFHLESDRWPDAINTGAVARYATSFARLITGLASGAIRMETAA